MNTIIILFIVTLFCFTSVEIVCQVTEVQCDVQLDLPYLVSWIWFHMAIPLVTCVLPTNSNVPYNFDNASTVITPNYRLTCTEMSVDVFSDANLVSCSCELESSIERLDASFSGFICKGFVLDEGSSPTNSVFLMRVSIGVTVPVITLITLVTSIGILLGIILCLVRRNRSASPIAARKLEESLRMRSIDTCRLSTNPYTPPNTCFEPLYGEVNFNDYDYIDEETTNLYSLGTYSNNSEELYRRMRQTKPVPSSEALYETIEEQIINVRTFSSSKNKTGTVSFMIVPTLEQRRSLQFSEYTKFQSEADYVEFTSEGSTSGYVLTANPVYREPSVNAHDLYDQMSTGKLLELNRDTITVLEKLGSGEYGEVSKGVWDSPVGDMNVALKVMSQDIDEQSKTAFLQEAAILGQFSHPNILRLVGVVTLTVPNMIVTELMQEELRRFLLALQTQHNQELDYDTIAPHFLSFSRQVARGMQHLAERGCIHRDIAARNILLTDRCVCKIADFGMSRRLEAESDYYRVKGSNKVPVKWSAPEAIFFKRFTLKSDVWSYGMLLYEIWSVGRKPWPYEDNRSTVEKLARGVNLPPPAGCSRAVYELMVSTWNPKPDLRPDMKDIVTRLSESDESLLARAELENRSGCNAPAFMLGADPIAAEELYKDLQNMYLSVQI